MSPSPEDIIETSGLDMSSSWRAGSPRSRTVCPSPVSHRETNLRWRIYVGGNHNNDHNNNWEENPNCGSVWLKGWYGPIGPPVDGNKFFWLVEIKEEDVRALKEWEWSWLYGSWWLLKMLMMMIRTWAGGWASSRRSAPIESLGLIIFVIGIITIVISVIGLIIIVRIDSIVFIIRTHTGGLLQATLCSRTRPMARTKAAARLAPGWQQLWSVLMILSRSP